MRILVAACGHCGVPDTLTTARLGDDVSVVWRPSLCEEAETIFWDRTSPDMGVLVLAGADIEVQARFAEEAIRAGVHALRLRFLDAWPLFPDAGTRETHVRAAIARLRDLGNLDGARTRETNRFQDELPRRSLLLPGARYRAPLPSIAESRCRASMGCDLCVRACPEDAIAPGIPPHIDPAKCTSCGLCLPVCPTCAVGHPSLDARAFLAEAEALADAPHLTLIVACARAVRTLRREGLPSHRPSWRILEVPALGALGPMNVLRLRRIGFDRVVGLSHGDCCPGTPGPFGLLASLLDGLGHGGMFIHHDLAQGPLSPAVLEPLFDSVPLPPADSLQSLTLAIAGPDAPERMLAGRGAGIVRIDPDACTLCGVCAERCWSAALRVEEPWPGNVKLTFDHARCDACGLCQEVCPERAVSLRYAVDPKAIGQRIALKEDTWVVCALCGTRVAPRAMVEQVAARMKRAVALDLCPDCKGRRILTSTLNRS